MRSLRQIQTDLIERYFIKSPRVRSLITKALYRRGKEAIVLAGSRLVVDRHFENGYYRASKKNRRVSFFRDEVSVLISLAVLLKPDTTFIDVGANVGVYSSVLSRFLQLYPDLSIVSYEVDPITYARLKENSEFHGFTANNKGISSVMVNQRFVRGAVSHVTTTTKNSNQYNIEGSEFNSDCFRLDQEPIEGNNIILKIDVEGQEYDVLCGAERLFIDNRVSAVYIDGYSEKENVIEYFERFSFKFVDVNTFEKLDHPDNKLLAVRENAYPS